MVCMYSSNSVFLPVHIIKKYHLFHVWMCFCAKCNRCSSSFPIKRFAYAGAILIPMAVPCIKVFIEIKHIIFQD